MTRFPAAAPWSCYVGQGSIPPELRRFPVAPAFYAIWGAGDVRPGARKATIAQAMLGFHPANSALLIKER